MSIEDGNRDDYSDLPLFGEEAKSEPAKVTQCLRVLQFLREFGSITRYQSFNELGIVELPARIVELKKEGYQFDQEMEHGTNRYGDPVRWMKYRLLEDR